MYESFKSNPELKRILEAETFPYSQRILELTGKLELDIFQISSLRWFNTIRIYRT